MSITDARHFLDHNGVIAPLREPAKAMADFHAGVIAYATDFDDTGVTLSRCFKCKNGTVEVAMPQDEARGKLLRPTSICTPASCRPAISLLDLSL